MGRRRFWSPVGHSHHGHRGHHSYDRAQSVNVLASVGVCSRSCIVNRTYFYCHLPNQPVTSEIRAWPLRDISLHNFHRALVHVFTS